MAENLDVFDFELTDDEMARLAGMNTGTTLFFDHAFRTKSAGWESDASIDDGYEVDHVGAALRRIRDMELGLTVIQFVHVGTGAVWFGASFFTNLVVLPFICRQAPARQRELVDRLILGLERILIGAALGAAVTGLVRGVTFGRIHSVADLMTPYGVVWVASIVVALVVFAVGGAVTSPAARALGDGDGAAVADVASRLARVRVGFRIELAGITTILALMVLLPRL